MSHFRDRVITTPGNIPQLPSGLTFYTIAGYRMSPPQLVVPIPVLVSVATDAPAPDIYSSAPPTLTLDALVPTNAVTATSP